MSRSSLSPKLAQTFEPVKSPINSQLPLIPDSMIHHKVTVSRNNKMIISYSKYQGKAYGVSRSRRVLSPQLLLKKFDYLQRFFYHVLGLTTAQREVALRLLRLWAYYGNVYPKEAQVTEEPGCSKASYWRTIRLLRDMGLISVTNRYVIRPHAQISNLYRFDKLLLAIARYLAEHGTAFYERWLTPALTMPGKEFWANLWQSLEPPSFPLIFRQQP